MAKVLCVLYDDPVSGHPKSYARDGIPKVESYPGGNDRGFDLEGATCNLDMR